jgi:3-methyladenine DNA glycosylase AlkD
MELSDALAALEAAGTEQNRKIYRRHGAGENQYGVSFKDLRALAKQIGRDHDLAVALWATGNADARLLACMSADPNRLTEGDLDDWIGDISYYVLVDEFVSSVASQVPGVRARMERWTGSDQDWTAQAGWDLAGALAMHDPDLGDAFFLDLLARIEGEIGRAGNRTRHAMNGALIAIGIRNDALRSAAVAAAERIGPVIVDHGETGCVTPPAIAYIEKSVAYRQAQAAKKAAREAAKPAVRAAAASR